MSSVDPGCAYGESQSLSFQVFDAGAGRGGVLIDTLRENVACAAEECDVVTDEASAYTVVFTSDAAGRILAAAQSDQHACDFSLLLEGEGAGDEARAAAERTAAFLRGICGS